MAARRVTLSPKDLPRFLDKVNARLQEEFIQAETDNIELAVNVARELSLGSTPLELIRQTHPYAKSNPAEVDTAVLNYHQGNIYEGWRGEGPMQQGSDIISILRNVDPESEYVLTPGGTQFMVERPILRRIVARIATKVSIRRREAPARAIQA